MHIHVNYDGFAKDVAETDKILIAGTGDIGARRLGTRKRGIIRVRRTVVFLQGP
jgi:hypothetical protein